MGKPFVRFCEGMRHNWCMAEIMWHRRETRRQTENTNVMPIALEGLFLLDMVYWSRHPGTVGSGPIPCATGYVFRWRVKLPGTCLRVGGPIGVDVLPTSSTTSHHEGTASLTALVPTHTGSGRGTSTAVTATSALASARQPPSLGATGHGGCGLT